MSTRDDFHELMRDNLVRWGARHEVIKARLGSRGTSAEREARRRTLDDWATRCAAGVATLNELRGASGDQWEVLKHEMALLWHDLSTFMAEAEKER